MAFHERRTLSPTGVAAQSFVGALFVLACMPAFAVQPNRIGGDRLVGHYWSQIRPNLHYDYGCETGWHAFSFRADGHFLFDRETAGTWWLDHLGNVTLLTEQGGERLLLFSDGGKTLAQRQRPPEAASSVFGSEYRLYQECEN